MKRTTLLLLVLLATTIALSQSKPKQKPPAQKELQAAFKELEAELKDLSPEERAGVKEMMKGMMTASPQGATLPTAGFTSNASLVPRRDAARIAKLPKTVLNGAAQKTLLASLRSKLEARTPASEKALLTKVLAKANTPALQMNAATLALLNGQRFTAMALSFRALQAAPNDPGYINNTAAILSQSGYPEQAIPLLQRLQKAFPDNSTLLHNLGFAWLQLGELDSAKRLFAGAAIRNPNNPETKFCQGVVEELKGDPKKATELLEEALQLSPDAFTADALKHLGEEQPGKVMTFDELKKRITIHEYFPKNWIRMPGYVYHVNSYDNNRAKRNGYDIMFDSLVTRLYALIDASGQEIEELSDKDFKTISGTLMKEMQAGLNPLSKTAAYISMAINQEIAESQQEFFAGYQQLQDKIRTMHDAIVTYQPGEKCEARERKDNAYMDAINPMIDSFFNKHLEDTRVWLNALCTWRPYLVGNPKNTVLTECLTWAKRYVEMYEMAVGMYVTEAPTCRTPQHDGLYPIAEPEIPNLNCKAKVLLPSGLDALDLSASTSDNPLPNSFGITPSKAAPMPNVTLTYGLNPRVLAEPGLHGRPFAKVSGGNVSASFHTAAAEELTPLSKILDPLTPLDPTLLPEGKSAAQNLEAQSDAAASRELLKRYSNQPCGEKKKFVLGIASIELETMIAWDPVYNKWVKMPEGLTPDDYKGSDLQFIGTFDPPVPEGKIPDAYNPKQPVVIGVGTVELEDVPPPPAPAPPRQAAERQTGQIIKEGLRTVIVNGLDAGIRVGQSIRALFD